MRFLEYAIAARLARDGDQRCPIELRISDPGNQVRGTWPQCRETHSWASAEPPVDVRHEGGTLFVPRGHKCDLFATRQGIHQVQVLFPWKAEDVLDSFVFKAPHEEFADIHDRISLSSWLGGRLAAQVSPCRRDDYCFEGGAPIHTVLMLTNSRIPNSPSSRP